MKKNNWYYNKQNSFSNNLNVFVVEKKTVYESNMLVISYWTLYYCFKNKFYFRINIIQ